jgi:hypothetical protein
MVADAAKTIGAEPTGDGFYTLEGEAGLLDGNDILWLRWWKDRNEAKWCPICEENQPCGCQVDWGAF